MGDSSIKIQYVDATEQAAKRFHLKVVSSFVFTYVETIYMHVRQTGRDEHISCFTATVAIGKQATSHCLFSATAPLCFGEAHAVAQIGHYGDNRESLFGLPCVHNPLKLVVVGSSLTDLLHCQLHWFYKH